VILARDHAPYERRLAREQLKRIRRDTRSTYESEGGSTVVVKIKQYLGNSHTLEVHNTNNEQTNCELDEIKVEHRHWYDSLTEAKADKSYDNCAWCLGASTR
jgi:hypothetical protein